MSLSPGADAMAVDGTNVLGANAHVMRTSILIGEIGLDGPKDTRATLFASGKTVIRGGGKLGELRLRGSHKVVWAYH